MSAPPAFQFYPDDFVGGTAGMPLEAIGAYILLLSYQWTHGALPADDASRARVVGQEFSPRWPATWAVLEAKFPGGRNQRLELVRAKHDAFCKSRRVNGAKGAPHGVKGGRPKKNPTRGYGRGSVGGGYETPLQSPVSSLHTPTPTPEKPTPTPPVGRGRHKAPAEGWESVLARGDYQRLRDDPRFGDAWGLWVKHCGESGARAVLPAGSQAAVLFNRALEWGGAKFAEAVENSIAHNWRGIDPAWLKNGHAQTPEKRMSIAERAALRFGVKD